MVVAYIFEGGVIGLFVGLLLRPVLDSYLLWRHAKELAREDAEVDEPAVDVAGTFGVPPPENNGHSRRHGADADEHGKRTSNW
jgi:hypothetical protein